MGTVFRVDKLSWRGLDLRRASQMQETVLCLPFNTWVSVFVLPSLITTLWGMEPNESRIICPPCFKSSPIVTLVK